MTIPITIPQGGDIGHYAYPGGPYEGLLYSSMDVAQALRQTGREFDKIMRDVAEEEAYEEQFQYNQAKVRLAENTEDWINNLGDQSFKDQNGIPDGNKIQQAYEEFRSDTSAQIGTSVPKSQAKQWQLDEARHWLATQRRVLAYRTAVTDRYIKQVMPRQLESRAKTAESYEQLEGMVNDTIKTMQTLQGRSLEVDQTEALWGPAEYAWIIAGIYDGTEEFNRRLSQTKHLRDREKTALTKSESDFREGKENEAEKNQEKERLAVTADIGIRINQAARGEDVLMPTVIEVDDAYRAGLLTKTAYDSYMTVLTEGASTDPREHDHAYNDQDRAIDDYSAGRISETELEEHTSKNFRLLDEADRDTLSNRARTKRAAYIAQAKTRSLNAVEPVVILDADDKSEESIKNIARLRRELNDWLDARTQEPRVTINEDDIAQEALRIAIGIRDETKRKEGGLLSRMGGAMSILGGGGMARRAIALQSPETWKRMAEKSREKQSELDRILAQDDVPGNIKELIRKLREKGIADDRILRADDLKPYLKGVK